MSIGLQTRLMLARIRRNRLLRWREYHREMADMHERRASTYHEQAMDHDQELRLLEARITAARMQG